MHGPPQEAAAAAAAAADMVLRLQARLLFTDKPESSQDTCLQGGHLEAVVQHSISVKCVSCKHAFHAAATALASLVMLCSFNADIA
jgi:hypothetical protein